MRKKNEFKPDRNGSHWISRLYLTEKQRKGLLKWVLYALVLVLLSVIQDVILCKVRIFGATTSLVPCAIFLITIMEDSERGSIFALTAAIIYQFSGTAPGMYCMVFITFLGVGVAILRQAFFQKRFSTAVLCTALAMLVYELLVFAIGWFLGLTIFARLPGFLLTAALSLLAVPILYPICFGIQSIGGETWKE